MNRYMLFLQENFILKERRENDKLNCDKKMLKFNLDSKDLKIKELISGDFLELEVYAINDDYPNRNNSHFTLESMKQAVPTCYNKPVLGAFNNEIGPLGDFEGHNDNGLHYDSELDELYYDYTSSDSEIPLGMIRESDNVSVSYDEKSKKNWLKLTCCLWCKYNFKAIKSLLKSRKGSSKISVEIEVLNSHLDDNGIEVIDKFALMGFTILGQKVTEGIENAHLSVIDLMETAIFQKKQKALCYAYSALEQYEKVDSEGSENNLENIQTNKLSENVDNEGEQEIEMNQEKQEGGRQEMLTYETKRGLLESYLRDKVSSNDYYYVWVCDLDNDNVYFEYDGHYYRAHYSIEIKENEEESVVTIDLESKEEVVRSWSVFEEDINQEEENCKNLEEETTEAAETKENEEEDDDASSDDDDASSDNENSSDENDSLKEKNSEENSAVESDASTEEQEACKHEAEETSEFASDSVELVEEPAPLNADAHSMATIIEESTESIAAPDVETKAEQLGDANEVLENSNENVDAVVVDESLANIDSNVSQGPNGENAVVVGEDNEEANIEQPDDEKKGEIFEAVETVELNGEKLNASELLVKYNVLEEKFEALNNEVKEKNAKDLCSFGREFINSDEEVDSDAKANYIAQVEEKCNSFEFTTKEEVTKFAKGLLAMYYYENRVVNKKENNSDFSISIERPKVIEEVSNKNKLKEAINKLNRI